MSGIVNSTKVLADRSLLNKIERHSDGMEVFLAAGANAQTLLKRLIESGAQIEKFEMIEPSLTNIFIEKVSESQ